MNDLAGKTVEWADDCAAHHRSKVLRTIGGDLIEIDHEDPDNPGTNQMLTVAEVRIIS